MLDGGYQVAVIDKVMLKVDVDEILKLSDEGEHCKDDLVNGDVEVDV